MVKTNVMGSMNVIEAAHDAGVSKVVALSTDKAFQPISPYGHSKALAESLFINANNSRGKNGPRFAVTRYGNVAGSRGSVIPKWRSMQVVVPVTDPEATRFWMTMDEACNLVMKAVREMPQDILVPDLPAYALRDLAAAMKKQILVTGLPAWEKKHESMREGETSETARRMSVEEIQEALQHV
jgi:UDP-N-acetylglucosamine 4,6-dehydratase